ncbi:MULTISPECIES: class I SAM-dependent methyltransferase [unclassified Paenibacillus]|uniref:class I SAM-dependent methyltransferase n=1 Tax=unclassified Paenibacillus TaxID=185978 RepID=UPI003644F929
MNNSSLLDQLIQEVSAINPLQKKSLDQYFTQLSSEEKQGMNNFADDYISYLKKNNYTIGEIAQNYSWMCKEVLREQIYFKRNGRYRFDKLEDTYKNVYSNEGYMEKYMIGVGVSQMLWKNHHDMFSFWLKHICSVQLDKYLEIGVGHGMFFKNAIISGNFSEYWGVDISETSLAMAKDVVNDVASNKQVNFMLKDVLEVDEFDGSIDFVTMGEVLEHVEKPELLVNKIAKMLKKDGKAYISTCANAPVIDHIYLFNNIEEIRQLFYSSNLEIMDEVIICNDNTPKDQWDSEKANLSYAAIVVKNK